MTLLKRDVGELKGIKPHTVARLHHLGLFTLGDLLFHLPLRYENRTRVLAINALSKGQFALVFGKVQRVTEVSFGRKLLVCTIDDGSGELEVKFFHYSFSQAAALKTAVYLQCFGEVRWGFNQAWEMIHPEYKIKKTTEQIEFESTLTPIYPTTDGLTQKTLRHLILQILSMCDDELCEYLPDRFLQGFSYPRFRDSIYQIHLPDPVQGINLKAYQRLAHEELITHYLTMCCAKASTKKAKAAIFKPAKKLQKTFLTSLPFTLTGAQQRVISEIAVDCAQAHPMLRLVQGDVGSGKTIVAAMTALQAIHSRYQVALMAPTELLAEQHFRNFKSWFDQFGYTILFLTGQLKGKLREQGLDALAQGRIDIVIGTHALFQEHVRFCRLGLVIIDEQHRFGVHQRLKLRDKGKKDDFHPHQLVMTATPIPRTLAMMQYADLDVSIIDELPPNRKPVLTRVLPAQRRDEVIAKIKDWVAQKRQVYWVCTLIDESEALQGEAAENTAERLIQALPSVRIGLVHGRMKAFQKDAIMRAFKQHELDLLVATTVIEVGVDVPNAGLMIIENSERLGLSQLHQLRGRVGRGDCESYCLLLYGSLPEMAKERLSIMREHHDGFIIAQKDLELRGAGEMLGERQKGLLRFKTVDLERDYALFEHVAEWGDTFFSDIPDNIPRLIARWMKTSENYLDV